MTPENFCYWLQGFTELNPNEVPTMAQWKSIQEHLAEVFRKVTPPVKISPKPILPAPPPPRSPNPNDSTHPPFKYPYPTWPSQPAPISPGQPTPLVPSDYFRITCQL